jgi:hypothetical protein
MSFLSNKYNKIVLYNDETAPSLMINLIWKWFLKNYMITSENDK